MTTDDLIAAFRELSQDDPTLCVSYVWQGGEEHVYLQGGNPDSHARFQDLAWRAAEAFKLKTWRAWLLAIVREAPAEHRPGEAGHVVEDGKRIPMRQLRIPNAARAAALTVRAMRGKPTDTDAAEVATDIRKDAQANAAGGNAHWSIRAAMLIESDPNITLEEIGRQVGKNKSTVWRNPIVRKAREMAGREIVKGSKSKETGIETNQPQASWKGEQEAIDDEIDRKEKEERNTTRNGKARKRL